MRNRWSALVLGLALIFFAIGCTKQVLPPDAKSVKLIVPNLFGG